MVIGITVVVAKLVDRRIGRRDLTPAAATRYRILRRSIFVTIVFVGVLSALLVIPQVRAVAAAILASSAVLGLVLGFAAQRTLGNFIAGLLIAFTQPVRLGDEVEIGGGRGIVEEIGLTYTWVRTPRQRPARDPEREARVRDGPQLHDPQPAHAGRGDRARPARPPTCARSSPRSQRDSTEAYVTELAADATIAVRTWVPDQRLADRAESDLRLTVHDRLRELGIVAAA